MSDRIDPVSLNIICAKIVAIRELHEADMPVAEILRHATSLLLDVLHEAVAGNAAIVALSARVLLDSTETHMLRELQRGHLSQASWELYQKIRDELASACSDASSEMLAPGRTVGAA